MKKAGWGILVLTLLYSYLFYEQNLGLNALLFCVFILAYFVWKNPENVKKLHWLLVAVCALSASVFVLLYTSSLASLAYCTSLLLLSAVSVKLQSSVLSNLFFALYSVVGALVFMSKAALKRVVSKHSSPDKQVGLRYLTYLIPLGIGFIFFTIYKQANPLFEKYTQWINLDFITGKWIFFSFGGLLVVYGLLRHQRIAQLDTLEDKLTLTIARQDTPTALNERKLVFILFCLLNLMLLLVNGLDVNYLYLGAGLPKGVTHKQFVHNGVGTLMLSIVLGISIILYFFRGALNFGEEHKHLRLLVYLWLLQNLLMVVSTAARNHIYITDALLTYKRIGVYYWLFMAALGLISTIHKVLYTKSAWYMVKNNALFAFVVLIFSAGVDWDKLISDFNLARVPTVASLDKRYLISISETNLAQLYRIKSHRDFNTDSSYHYQSYRESKNTADLDAKLVLFLANNYNTDWRSFSLRTARVMHEIQDLNKSGKLLSLDLTRAYLLDMRALGALSNVRKLEIDTYGSWIEIVNSFKKLDTVCLNYFDDKKIPALTKLPKLKAICFAQTDTLVIKKVKQQMPHLAVINANAKAPN